MIDDDSPITDPYADIAELYDLEHDDYDEDIEFYVGMLETLEGPVLEMGAGSGRLLIPIAETGTKITGLDSSAPMLARARERIASSPERRAITLFEGTMDQAATAPGSPFGVVLFSLNALMHLPTPSDQRSALEAAFASLKPGGHIVIDTMNPTHEQLQHLTSRNHLEGTWEMEDGSVIDKWSHRELDSVDQVLDTLLYYEITRTDGTLKRTRTQFPLRFVYPNELDLQLTAAGFCEIVFRGSYQLDPLTDDSDRIIAIASKPA
jgi:2-polyprenyl-3-methyl-5-hydroxy-6-metoxy-1,4-benzoquinol methylase